MYRSLIIALAFALVSVSAFAADTASVDVSATVSPTCTFDATNFAMAFGAIDPTSAVDATATATVSFTCNTNDLITLDDLTGAYTMLSGADTLNYSIASGAIPTNGTAGLSQSVTLTGTVAVADFQAAVAGSYTDAVAINILP